MARTLEAEAEAAAGVVLCGCAALLLAAVGKAALDGAKSSVELAISLAGAMTLALSGATAGTVTLAPARPTAAEALSAFLRRLTIT